MALREDIRTVAEAEIDAKAAEEHDERGCGTGIEYHFDGPGRSFAGYTVTVELDNGLTKTFPRVNATEKPDSQEIHERYGHDLIEEIKRRRAELKAEPR